MAGQPLGALRGLSRDDYEAIYAVGHGLYQQGRYQDACHVFSWLALHHHMERRFISALAASLQMCQRHEDALRIYTVAAVLDPADPIPTYHMAECLIATGRLAQALEALAMVVAQCRPGAHDALRQRAQALEALLSRRRTPQEGAPHHGH